jgi:AraC-like DNA-binding protein
VADRHLARGQPGRAQLALRRRAGAAGAGVALLAYNTIQIGLYGLFGVSPRYVRMIFAARQENVSAYILRRRLEECAQQLTSVLWSGHTIAETASSWGFTSMAHFTRAFKDRFGVTPRQYRRQHLIVQPAAEPGRSWPEGRAI